MCASARYAMSEGTGVRVIRAMRERLRFGGLCDGIDVPAEMQIPPLRYGMTTWGVTVDDGRNRTRSNGKMERHAN